MVYLNGADEDRRPHPGREAVLNAVKHAAPRSVEVSLEHGEPTLTLRVVDGGTGIPPGGTVRYQGLMAPELRWGHPSNARLEV